MTPPRSPRAFPPAALAVLAACGGGAPGGAPPGGPGGGPPAVAVEVAVTRRARVEDRLGATGQIEPLQQIELRPDIEGRLVEILVQEGREVAAGQPLFRVDDVELKAQVDRAEADRDLARQSLERTRDLLRQRAAAQADLERAEAQMRSTEAGYELLKVRLERTVVRAPFAGIAGQRYVSLGDYVNTGTRLLSLQTVNPQRAAFQVPERFAAALRDGQRVRFVVAALAGREFEGVVEFIDPVVRLPGRTITVKARVSNPRRELQAGMFLEAQLVTAVRPDALVISEDAVLTLGGDSYVWVVRDSTVARTPVVLGVREPGLVEVVRGLEDGTPVVVGGLERLSEGARVLPRVVERRAVDPLDLPGATPRPR